uniref:Uncharacterized protein n=1 Tax=Nelumbo nucifera TaxID=4432 RepID=A0A822XXA0_NELNU|nr:TPA_asm: hypothetical protein HUJ06_023491 [Nelumbo nucifera]
MSNGCSKSEQHHLLGKVAITLRLIWDVRNRKIHDNMMLSLIWVVRSVNNHVLSPILVATNNNMLEVTYRTPFSLCTDGAFNYEALKASTAYILIQNEEKDLETAGYRIEAN